MKRNMEEKEEKWKKNTERYWGDSWQKYYIDRMTESLIGST